MPKQRTGIRLVDVAERAGVSIATASRALSGANGVSDSAAEHVRRVADQLGYVANLHARSLASGADSGIGLVVHEIGDPYFSEIASGVLQVAAANGRIAQICHTGRDPHNEVAQIRALIAHHVGVIIIAGSGFEDPEVQSQIARTLQPFEQSGGRVAVIGRKPGLAVDAVLPDNVAGGQSIAEHLLSLGHRHIALASGSRQLTTMTDRLAGIDSALRTHGLSLDDLPIAEAEFTLEGGKIAARRILDQHPDVTAIMALNDDMAIGVLSVLRERGIPVPHRISVTGFDDVTVSQYLSPSLTTVQIPMATMGEIALELALKPKSSRPRRRKTSHTLAVRDSTGPPPTTRQEPARRPVKESSGQLGRGRA